MTHRRVAEDIVSAVRIPGAIAVGVLDQGDGHARQARLAAINIAAAVGIHPQGVADEPTSAAVVV